MQLVESTKNHLSMRRKRSYRFLHLKSTWILINMGLSDLVFLEWTAQSQHLDLWNSLTLSLQTLLMVWEQWADPQENIKKRRKYKWKKKRRKKYKKRKKCWNVMRKKKIINKNRKLTRMRRNRRKMKNRRKKMKKKMNSKEIMMEKRRKIKRRNKRGRLGRNWERRQK